MTKALKKFNLGASAAVLALTSTINMIAPDYAYAGRGDTDTPSTNTDSGTRDTDPSDGRGGTPGEDGKCDGCSDKPDSDKTRGPSEYECVLSMTMPNETTGHIGSHGTYTNNVTYSGVSGQLEYSIFAGPVTLENVNINDCGVELVDSIAKQAAEQCVKFTGFTISGNNGYVTAPSPFPELKNCPSTNTDGGTPVKPVPVVTPAPEKPRMVTDGAIACKADDIQSVESFLNDYYSMTGNGAVMYMDAITLDEAKGMSTEEQFTTIESLCDTGDDYVLVSFDTPVDEDTVPETAKIDGICHEALDNGATGRGTTFYTTNVCPAAVQPEPIISTENMCGAEEDALLEAQDIVATEQAEYEAAVIDEQAALDAFLAAREVTAKELTELNTAKDGLLSATEDFKDCNCALETPEMPTGPDVENMNSLSAPGPAPAPGLGLK